MTFDPIALAEEVKRAYAVNLVGSDPVAFKGLMRRLGDESRPLEEKLDDLVRMKGPYLQALGAPIWAEEPWPEFARSVRGQFAPNGLEPEIIEAFEGLGFRRLYRFQEEGIRAVLDDQHTLIVAATGRGKTESWMIPLFQYIVAHKKGKIEDRHLQQSTKALLIYPTKALAQDQLKRIIAYLMELNGRLAPDLRITVGIFDGDTPNYHDADCRKYLYASFKYFQCPLYEEDRAECQYCGRSLVVSEDRLTDRLVLAVPQPDCRSRCSLDFIYLTREDVVNYGVDIVLTNPDTINLRLLNINQDQQRRTFVEQPKFVVLDEVHTYSGLFGAFVSLILKRLQRARQELVGGESDIRFIAASATVANKEELFSRLCGLGQPFATIEEQTRPAVRPTVEQFPQVLLQHHFEGDDLVREAHRWREQQTVREEYRELLQALGLSASALEGLSDLEISFDQGFTELLQGQLADEKALGNPVLESLLYLHALLSEQVMTPAEFIERVRSDFPALGSTEAETLLYNFVVLGTACGLLENRVHLFAWPVDGYYKCVVCGKVYDEPQQRCACGGEFISRLTLCDECGEEAIESWFCPACQRVYPRARGYEGENIYFQTFYCLCTGQETQCYPIIWKPFYECSRCHRLIQRREVETCETCKARLVPQDDHLVCSNPDCRQTRPYATSGRECPACGGETALHSAGERVCLSCGQVQPTSSERCDCGGVVVPVLQVPWICRRCGRPYFAQEAPARCNCGARTFGLGALFDIGPTSYCPECKAHFLQGYGCGNEGHTLRDAEPEYREFKVIDGSWRVRRPADFREVVPCYHRYAKYHKNTRYDPLIRSPDNVAVTSAQFLLRRLVGDDASGLTDRLLKAKVLSFSDSHTDMTRLGRDFNEPERRVFIDQLVMRELESGPLSLADLSSRVFSAIESFGQQLAEMQGASGTTGSVLWSEFGDDGWVAQEVESRFIPGYYNRQRRYHRSLVRDGLADIGLQGDDLSEQECEVLRALARANYTRYQTLRNAVGDAVEAFAEVLEGLERNGVICIEDEIISFNPASLLCSAVGRDNPISWDPPIGRFYPQLDQQLGGVPAGLVRFTLSGRERSDFSHPNFSRTAYTTYYSQPVALRSRVYKGDVEKQERRELEFRFKYGGDIHFLSSGPAMEVGIDIGDLDFLLLFGTPPNVNSYLQRIGRAGRRTKRSLVMSVSKRNPIDYYYYRYPTDLISSEAQPVPLNEHNEEVMRVSLTWAFLDYVTSHYWVPWRSQTLPEGTLVTDGAEITPLAQPRPADIEDYLRLVYGHPAQEINYGRSLQVLESLLHDRRDDVEHYLDSLFPYKYCPRCGEYHPADYTGPCQVEGCPGLPVRIAEHFVPLFCGALDEFGQHMIWFVRAFRAEVRRQRRALEDRRREAEDELDFLDPSEVQRMQELNRLISHLRERIQGLGSLEGYLEGMPLVQIQQRSPESKYAYGIRTVGEVVDTVEYRAERGRRQVRWQEPRDAAMAIKERHPYAVLLQEDRKYVVCSVAFDEWKTDQLCQRLEQMVDVVPGHVCPNCGCEYLEASSGQCVCGGRLVRYTDLALREAHLYPLDFILGPHPERDSGYLTPRDIYRFSTGTDEVKSTYAHIQTLVSEFSPTRSFDLANGSGETIGSLEFGRLELLSLCNAATVAYKSGLRDPRPQLFELCADGDCHGVVVQGSTVRYCALDPSHDPNRRRWVRLGRLFATEGLRVWLSRYPVIVTHSLNHGFRLALEKIGGVLVRNIGEVSMGDIWYTYDTEPGGSGVCVLLTDLDEGRYKNFEAAMQLVRENLDCTCADGCPRCLYQYGCEEWNSPRTLSRQGLLALLGEGLRLAPADEASPPTPTPVAGLDQPVWSAEEAAAREVTWNAICELEARLRRLIEARYQTRYGEDWMERVNQEMRQTWAEARAKDERTFARYGQPAPSLLDYSYLGDLLALINAEWALFQDVFGSGKIAKRQLRGKIEDIIRVRNPLAHNRAVPENELKRAEVYCTDVLMLLQKVSEDSRSRL